MLRSHESPLAWTDANQALVHAKGVLGVGTDIVNIPSFTKQLSLPGSRLMIPGEMFAAAELRRSASQAKAKGDDIALHLGAIWALKEAALKAWVLALEKKGSKLPFTKDQVKWAQIRVHHYASGAPQIVLFSAMLEGFQASLPEASWSASASHDGDYAVAFVVLSE